MSLKHLKNVLHADTGSTLSTIASDIATVLNEAGLEDAEKPSVSTIVSRSVEALGRLSLWRSRLPNSLYILDPKDLPEPKVSDNLDLYSTRFRVFLSLRYLSTRILAYREILDLYLKDLEMSDISSGQNDPFGLVNQALLEDCANCCRLVIDIAKTVMRVSGVGVNINGAWWLSVHHGEPF